MQTITHHEAVAEYMKPRSETDIDLVTIVRQKLFEAGLGLELSANFDNNNYIVEASNKTPEVQRFLLNRFWHIQLMSVPVDSIEERFCLVPNGSLEDWLRLFEQKIVPFAITHRLPVSI